MTIKAVKFGRLYCDMDGVLCDFRRGFNSLPGAHTIIHEYHADLDKDDWQKVNDTPNFWLNLKPMFDAHILWKYIKKYNPAILTAWGGNQSVSCGQKVQWCWNHLGVPGNDVLCVKRSEKKQYVTNGVYPNILIDDYEKNTTEWIAQGGIAIVHKNAARTIQDLKKLGL